MLGMLVRNARLERGWKLTDLQDVLREAGADVSPSQIKRMEDGTRPGDPAVWGKMWETLRLPLRDLYEGLGLPVPETLPSGSLAELMELARDMPEESRLLTLMFARHAPGMAEVVAQRHSPLATRQDHPADSTPPRSTRPLLVAEEKADYPARQAPGGPVDG